MTIRADFAAFLKKGKKQSVIDGIVADVVLFEQFLRKTRGKSIKETETDDILRFVSACEKGKNLGKKLRSIFLFSFKALPLCTCFGTS